MTELLPTWTFRNKLLEYVNTPSQNKVILTEADFERLVQSLIYESLSISNEVTDVTHYLMRTINKEVHEKANKEQDVYEGELTLPIFNQPYKVEWIVYNYDKNKQNYPIGASISLKSNILKVAMVKVYGEMDNTSLSDSLQHEIEHLFQYLKKQRDNIFNDKDTKLYNKAVELISNHPRDSFHYRIGQAVYLMFDAEQDAFVNGLYASVKNTPKHIPIYEVMRRSDAYRQIDELRMFNEEIQNPQFFENEEVIECLKFLNKSGKWLKNHTNKALKRFARKIAHVRNKINSEKF